MSEQLPALAIQVCTFAVCYVALRQVVAPALVHLYEHWYPPPPQPRWDEIYAELERQSNERMEQARADVQRSLQDWRGP